jgi:hypothetical protein
MSQQLAVALLTAADLRTSGGMKRAAIGALRARSATQFGSATAWVTVLFLGATSLSGCVAVSRLYGLKPIHPAPRQILTARILGAVDADSLQPEFRWEASPNCSDCTYDFAIWDAEAVRRGFWQGSTGKQSWGPPVYYVQDLKATAHRISTTLLPDREYCWSVRLRRGTVAGHWSAYDQSVYGGGGESHALNVPFYFRTPKHQNNEAKDNTHPAG